MASLLAVDLGVRTGLAMYDRDGKLVWYRSRNFGSASRLRNGVQSLLREYDDVVRLVMEGGGPLEVIWRKEADRRGIESTCIGAEVWRQSLLMPRQQKSGKDAKQHADALARRIIEWSGAPKPTSLRHDAAEAIVIGLWGVMEVGWLESLPVCLKKP